MKKVSLTLNILLIAASFYALFTLGEISFLFMIAVLVGGVVCSFTVQSRLLARLSYLGNVFFSFGALAFSILSFMGQLPTTKTITDSLLLGVAVFVFFAIPTGLNAFYVKVRYFPRKIKPVN
ncbi:hypothetical protein [Enterovibrio calviensis]|uniref:hypothetical protein n=1 Tax=Enterovibrio calviensis TaxID=91359 RepID=UPI0004816592|nr:hypothetical protein [Enterovibrio calviensis]